MIVNKQYKFPVAKRSMLESLQHPLAAYQFIDDKIVTLLVSDGMCHLAALERPQLIQLFNTDMYRGTHPDDVERVAELAHRFIVTENEYDVTYRTILYGKMEYRYLHAISKFHTMEDGSRVAITMYDDVTDLIKKESENAELVDTPKAKFLYENMSAMAVVDRTTKKLLFYNNALVKMIPPKVKYDSGRTFQDFFYHGMTGADETPLSIAGLYDNIDTGPSILTEPVTGRPIEVTTVTSNWGDIPSYILFFFECTGDESKNIDAHELRQRRIVFNSIMNGAESNGLQYYESGYKAYWIWNLSKDGILVKDGGHEQIHKKLGASFNYMQYWNFINALFDGPGDHDYAEMVTLKGLKKMYSEGISPKSKDFTVHNENGQVTLRTDFIMMQSPDDDQLYLKVTEENVTESTVEYSVLNALVKKQFDFIVYIDVPGNRCRIINGNTTNSLQEDVTATLTELSGPLADRIGLNRVNSGSLVQQIEDLCKETDESVYTHKISENSIKNIVIDVLSRHNRQYFICCRDITTIMKHEKEIQEKLQDAFDAAEKANLAKSEFVSRISHDIRTPISIISTMTDFAIEDMDNRGKLANDLNKIHIADTFLLSLINDVLDISKIDSGKISLRPEKYLYSEYVENLRVMFQSMCNEKDIIFEMVEDYSINGSMMIDRTRLNQISLNILSNAVKYTLPGGKVSFISHSEVCKDNPIKIKLCFEVIDTGIGMSKEFVQNMFEPFSQESDNPLRPKSEIGTGLGLFIVKKMIDIMGGKIEVNSELGKGTDIKCTFECPYIPEENTGTKSEKFKGIESDKQPIQLYGHLLIAEDNQINLEIIQRLIQNCGLTADSAENGRITLEKYANAPDGTYAAILMDVQMPIMNGIEATKKIRASGKSDAKTIPIIAMTANAFDESVQIAMQAGISEYLTKPIDYQKLYRTLEKFIKNK